MARPSVIVDGVSEVATAAHLRGERLAPTTPAILRVKLRGGQSVLLDMNLPQSAIWADVLQSLRDTGQPAYVEVNPETKVITQLLLPRAVMVESVAPTVEKDGVQVELMISHARHFLRRSNANYNQLLRALETARKEKATVLVTETPDTHEIIDVRPVPVPTKRRRE